jgi:hypothetical protein
LRGSEVGGTGETAGEGKTKGGAADIFHGEHRNAKTDRGVVRVTKNGGYCLFSMGQYSEPCFG